MKTKNTSPTNKEQFHQEAQQIKAQVADFANMMDSNYRIPGTKITLGADAIIGVLPIGGDTLCFISTFYLLYLAKKIRAPKTLMLRMVVNSTVDLFAGFISIFGDVFDAYLKSNKRNSRLLIQYIQKSQNQLG